MSYLMNEWLTVSVAGVAHLVLAGPAALSPLSVLAPRGAALPFASIPALGAQQLRLLPHLLLHLGDVALQLVHMLTQLHNIQTIM